MYRSHPEVAVLIDEGNGRGGDKAERERNHEAHDEDHDAVEPAQFVSPQSGEGNKGGRAVDDGAGEDAPDKYAQPRQKANWCVGNRRLFLPHLIEILNSHGGVQAKHSAYREFVLKTCHLGHLVILLVTLRTLPLRSLHLRKEKGTFVAKYLKGNEHHHIISINIQQK